MAVSMLGVSRLFPVFPPAVMSCFRVFVVSWCRVLVFWVQNLGFGVQVDDMWEGRRLKMAKIQDGEYLTGHLSKYLCLTRCQCRCQHPHPADTPPTTCRRLQQTFTRAGTSRSFSRWLSRSRSGIGCVTALLRLSSSNLVSLAQRHTSVNQTSLLRESRHRAPLPTCGDPQITIMW